MNKQTLYCIKHHSLDKYLGWSIERNRYELLDFEDNIELDDNLNNMLITLESHQPVFYHNVVHSILERSEFVIVELELREIKKLD